MENNTEQPAMRGKMAIVAKKFKLGEEPSDYEYWQTKSYEERIAAVTAIRNEYHGWTDETRPRLQRVFTIVNLETK